MTAAAYTVNNEALTFPTPLWWLIGIVGAIYAVWFLTTWLRASADRQNATWEHDLPMLTDDAQWCAQRGHHLWDTVPGTDRAMCRQCGATHTHEPKAHGTVWLCRCGHRKARYALDYQDEALS